MTRVLRPGTGSPRVLLASGPDALASTAADLVVAAIAGAIGLRGIAHVALTGGSSASGLYRALREPARAAALDWSRVHLWFGDDRVVGLDHPDSNAGLAMRELLGPPDAPVARGTVHPMLGGVDTSAPDAAQVAAARYTAELAIVPSDDAGMPILDLLLLGMGPDGHVLSVFPGSRALDPGAPAVMPIPAPTHIGPSVARVTLHPAVIAAAHRVLLMVGGAAKAAVLADVLQGDPAIETYPARLARIDSATWLLDPDSAGALSTGAVGTPDR
jgi:6-phosphogluconolactonase